MIDRHHRTQHHAAVICPVCKYPHGDTWEWVRDHPEEHACEDCGSVLKVWAEYDVTYYAELVRRNELPLKQREL